MDFDPRDYDSRDDERHSDPPSRGHRGSREHDRDDNRSQPETRTRERDDDDGRSLGRGPDNDRHGADQTRPRDYDARWAGRDRDGRERDRETRDTFTRH